SSGDTGYRDHDATSPAREDALYRHLRPGAWRRPDPVPTLLLVLLPPGGVHHDSAGVRDYIRTDRRLLTTRNHGVQVRCPEFGRYRVPRLPRVGTPHVRVRTIRHILRRLFPDHLSYRDPDGCQ